MFRVERQFLQRRDRWVAFEESVEAPMTIPGIRTNLEIVLALKVSFLSRVFEEGYV